MTASADVASGNVRRLQPLRVLLSGGDRRFVRVTSFLLARRGYDVSQVSPGDAVEAAERQCADVVVLETNGSRADAARKVAALQALAASPGVLVVVDDGSQELWTGLETIRKWVQIDELAEAIEAASARRPTRLADAEERAL